MGSDARFYQQFSAAVNAIHLEHEAALFQEVLDIAVERKDRKLAKLAERYRDQALAGASEAIQGGPDGSPVPDFVLEIARVAQRHPSGTPVSATVYHLPLGATGTSA